MNEELLKVVDNSINTVLWISSDKFLNSSLYFQEFNYLTNGILEKKEENLQGLYQTNFFNKPINIALIEKGPQQSVLDASKDLLSLVAKNSPSKILLVHENIEDKLVEKFKKKFGSHEFVEFKSQEENKDA
ncbi:hypothetical protein [Halobacteriovorax sp.]|uniref:hypothetical protein n=1 Tax=Halobacteriovorax sp. TaxID=2020862 RepID=UPI0035676054